MELHGVSLLSFSIVVGCRWKCQLEVLPENEAFLYLGLVATGHISYCDIAIRGSIRCQARHSLLVRIGLDRSVEVGLACIHLSFLL